MNPKLKNPVTHLRGPIARGVEAGAVDRTGGEHGAGIIRGLAVVTRGEAVGHGDWIDRTFLGQVNEAIGSSPSGTKARFAHPGLSGDGIGKFLGRLKDSRLDGDDVVRADLHFSPTAHKTPDGDLAGYVMDLAEQDPAAFGTSISFTEDKAAQEQFRKEKGARSPDPDNQKNLRHVRLETLHATDIVDSPAANPGGLFHRGQEAAAEAEQLLAYSFGMTDQPPELVELGIDADRGAGFVRRFLDRHGLQVIPRKETEMKEKLTDRLRETGEEARNDEATEAEGDRGGSPKNRGGSANGGAPKDGTSSATKLADKPPVGHDSGGGGPSTTPTTAGAGKEELAAAIEQGKKEELARVQALTDLASDDVQPELLKKAIDENWSTEKASGEFLKELRDSRTPAVRVGRERGDDLNLALSDALMLTGGVPLEEDLENRTERVRNANEFDGAGLHDLGRILLSRAGKRVGISPDTFFADAVSTASLPLILGDTLNRSLHRGYMERKAIFPQIAATRQVKDFREYHEIKLSQFASMEALSDGGKMAHDTMAESEETYQVDTRAKMFTLTRKTFINDDLGSFTRAPRMLGRAASRSIDEQGFALLIANAGVGPQMKEDSTKLFATSGHDSVNYFTGAGSALGDTGLAKGKELLFKTKQGDVDIEVEAKFLLVPPELDHTAKKLIQSSEMLTVLAGTTDAKEVVGTSNVHRGTVTTLTSARLSAATNGTTAWYLFADPNDVPVFVVVYLRGNRLPRIERVTLTDILGFGWRAYHDSGVAAIDWRGAIRAKGV